MTFLIPPDRFLWGEGMLLIRAVIVRKVKEVRHLMSFRQRSINYYFLRREKVFLGEIKNREANFVGKENTAAIIDCSDV